MTKEEHNRLNEDIASIPRDNDCNIDIAGMFAELDASYDKDKE